MKNWKDILSEIEMVLEKEIDICEKDYYNADFESDKSHSLAQMAAYMNAKCIIYKYFYDTFKK